MEKWKHTILYFQSWCSVSQIDLALKNNGSWFGETTTRMHALKGYVFLFFFTFSLFFSNFFISTRGGSIFLFSILKGRVDHPVKLTGWSLLQDGQFYLSKHFTGWSILPDGQFYFSKHFTGWSILPDGQFYLSKHFTGWSILPFWTFYRMDTYTYHIPPNPSF